MTVSGRLGTLLVVLGGAAFLLMDGLHSPPGLWYVAGSVVAGTTMIGYTVIPSSSRRPKTIPDPTPSPSTSTGSKRDSTTRQTDSQPTSSEQPADSTESTDQEPDSVRVKDPDSTEPPFSEEPELPLTTVEKSHHFPAKTRTTKRIASHTGTSRTRKTASKSTYRKSQVTSTASKGPSPSSETDNSYFTPVDSSREIKFAQADTTFSYVDIDWGPEVIGLDPIPDLIEVDVGPSVWSQELVRSPVEFKMSSLLKSLLTPTPRRTGAPTADDSTRPSSTTDSHTRQRTDAPRPRREQVTRDSRETRYREEDRLADRTTDRLTAFDRMNQSTGKRPQSPEREPGNRRQPTADVVDFGGWENEAATGGGYFDDRPFLQWEPLKEEPICTQDVETVDEPAVDVGLAYSPPWSNPPQPDADPFGMRDFDPGFAEPGGSGLDSVEQSDLGFGAFDWEPDVSIMEPAVEPGFGEEMYGLDGFAKPPDEAAGLLNFNSDNGANPLLPAAEGFFPGTDFEEDWLSF